MLFYGHAQHVELDRQAPIRIPPELAMLAKLRGISKAKIKRVRYLWKHGRR